MPSRESQLAALKASLCPYCGLDFADSGGVGFELCPNCKQPLKWVEGSEIDIDTGKPIYGPCVPGVERWAKQELDRIAVEAAEKAKAASRQFGLAVGLAAVAVVLLLVAAIGYRGITAMRARWAEAEKQRQAELMEAEERKQNEIAEAERRRQAEEAKAKREREWKRIEAEEEAGNKIVAKARELCTQENGGPLIFKGDRLSNEQAEVLAKYAQLSTKRYGLSDSLRLPNLTFLVPEAAQALADRTGRLEFDSLNTMSDEVAEALSKHRGNLYLRGLAALSDKQAESLAKHRFQLCLGIVAISDKQAELLAKHRGERLSLNGLTALSDTAAEALSKHKCWLDLNGLTTLSDKQAESLAKHDGSLYLNGLITLSERAAETLKHPKGYVKLPNSL